MIMITINSIAMNVINHKCNNDISKYDNILIVVIIFYIFKQYCIFYSHACIIFCFISDENPILMQRKKYTIFQLYN